MDQEYRRLFKCDEKTWKEARQELDTLYKDNSEPEKYQIIDDISKVVSNIYIIVSY